MRIRARRQQWQTPAVQQQQTPPTQHQPPLVQHQPPQAHGVQKQPQEPATVPAVSRPRAEKGTRATEQHGASLLDGLSSWLGGDKPSGEKQPGGVTGLLQSLLPPIPLNDAEKKQVAAAAETLKKLAGEDGRWDGRDLKNNLQQMGSSLRNRVDERIQQEFDRRTGGSRIKRAIGQRVLNRNYCDYVSQGMGIARQTAFEGMVGGQDAMGMKRLDDYGRQANGADPKAKRISTEEMERFGATMKMIEQKAKAAGYPPRKFANGLPVEFLELIRDGKLPVGVR